MIMMKAQKPLIKVGAIIFTAAVILAATFHIVQSQHNGCWDGDETTNFDLQNGKVMCCNGVDILVCALNAVQCVQSGSASYCYYKDCYSCFVLWGIASIALVILVIGIFQQIRSKRAPGYANLQ